MTEKEAKAAYNIFKIGKLALDVDEMIAQNVCFFCAGELCRICGRSGKQSIAERLEKLESFK